MKFNPPFRLFTAVCTLLLPAPGALAAGPQAIAAQAPSAETAASVTAAAPDPVRLAAARTTIDAVFPPGTYARLMGGTMDQMMDSVMKSTMDMPLRDLSALSGVDASKLGTTTLAQITQIYDPAFQERTRLGLRAMMGEMSTLMTRFEPEMRDGLARAYAQRFDARQLGEMNAFFATPTGKAYAADSYVIMMSPEVMAKMQAFMPLMMKEMPSIIEKTKTATASLPAPRTYDMLSNAEKDKLATLLGTTRAKLDESEEDKAAPGQ